MSALFRLSGAEKRDPIIDEWLNKTDALTAVARTWFRKLRACGDDVLELMHDGHPTVCVEDVPFAYVDVFKTHTNVGFFYGAHLDDPVGLLEGTGKNMRHVKLKPGHELDSAALGRFRHAQPGSFVLNVSCPVHSMDLQAPSYADPGEAPWEPQSPFARRAIVVLHHSLTRLVNAIETDSLDSMIQTEKKSSTPLISSNFCEALTRLEDRKLKNSIEIAIAWAAFMPTPGGEKPVRVWNDYFSRIEEVRRELRSFDKADRSCPLSGPQSALKAT